MDMASDETFPTVEETRILVIDDDESTRRVVSAYLKNAGYQILQADNGQAGLAIFQQEKPDVVLCDLHMPGMEGAEVIEKMVALDEFTPVIVISGEDDVQQIVDLFTVKGAIGYLLKPIKDHMLVTTVQSAIEKAQLKIENYRIRQELESSNKIMSQTLRDLEQDQKAGRLVQTSLLPVTPFEGANVALSHKIVPSLYLSGDFVDYWETESGELLFYIADVSGHGSSSAFVTVLLKYLMKKLSVGDHDGGEARSPSEIFSLLNKELIDSNLQKHVTAFLGKLDSDKTKMTYSVAGHYPMPIACIDGEYRFLEGRSFPLGIKSDADYDDQELELGKDYSLNLFSDGVLELLQKGSLQDKEASLLSIIEQSHGEFIGIRDRLNLESAPSSPDDVAMLTLQGNRSDSSTPQV